jgi:nitroreductase
MKPSLAVLLEAARAAPSADNMQPWRFTLDEDANRISIQFDEGRKALAALVDEQRMDRLAMGAVLENIEQAASHNGWQLFQEPPTPPGVATFRLREEGSGSAAVPPAILNRVTNRKLYDGRTLAADVLSRLGEKTPPLEGILTHWITDRSRLPALGKLLGRADTLRFAEPALRRSLLSKLRFDQPDAPDIAEGLSLGSLELSGAERFALRLVPRMPEWLLRCSGALSAFGDTGRRQVESASGLCLITAPAANGPSDLLVGRAMQRAWLAATTEVMAAQPLMSLVGLETFLEQESPHSASAKRLEEWHSTGSAFRASAGLDGNSRLGAILRFGFAHTPTVRCGRRPLESFLSNTTASITSPSNTVVA